jgi:pimeloyl-ACP methyl ester carboxylesterase
MNVRLGLAPAALALALAAAACGTGGDTVQTPPLVTSPADTAEPSTSARSTAPSTSQEPASTQPSEEPAATVTSSVAPLPPITVEQVDCPAELRTGGLSCGLATVPVDRSDPSTGTTRISLASLVGQAPEASPPLAVLQGGPGGSSTELTSFYPTRPFTQVFIDQRGTGFGDSDFDCPEIDEVLVEVLGAPSERAEDIELAAYDRCAARLAGDSVFETTDTETHARDVQDVMSALGYDQWLVYGVSYGTTIALELMRTAPEGLMGAVLDGVYPTDLDVDAAIGESATTSLGELDRACAEDPGCDAIVPDVIGALERVMDRLESEPLTVTVGEGETLLGSRLDVYIDDEVLAGMVFRFLYDEARFRFVPGLLDGLDRGDPGTARWLARAVVDLSVSALAYNDDGTWFAVQCADRLPFTDGPPPGLSDYAAVIADPGLQQLCEPWARSPSPATAGEPVRSDVPALLLGGQLDPITPPYHAERVASGLTSATVVIQAGRGHGIWFGDNCIASLVEAFVSDPRTPLETSCAASGVSIDWRRPSG